MTLLEAEGRHERGIYTRTLETVFNDDTFFMGKEKFKGRLKVEFNPDTFTSIKTLLDKVRLAGGNGWASPQTARGQLGYDNEKESGRMKEAGGDAKSFTPPFEAKQGGIAAAGGDKGGRPEGPTK